MPTQSANFAIDKPQTTKPLTLDRWISSAAYWSTFYVFSWLVMHAYIVMGRMNHNQYATLPMMVYGTAQQPFIYRTLTATLIRWLTPLVPMRLGAALAQSNLAFRQIFVQLDGMTYPRESLLCLLVQYLALITAALALRQLMQHLRLSEARVNILTLIFPLTILPFSELAYIYDLPSLAFWCLCLLALAREEWNLYLILFALANIQKETAALLVIVFAVWAWKRTPLYGLLLANQIGIAMLAKVLLLYLYLDTPGVLIQRHFTDNLWYMAHDPAALGISLLIYALMAWWIARRWHGLPLFLRCALAVIPPFVVVWLYGGLAYEIRVFLDIWPVLFLMIGV